MRTSKTVLKLNGQPFNPKPDKLPKVTAYLNAAPKDELFTPGELSVKLGFNACYMKNLALYDRLAGYTALVSGRRYYGNPAAIAELKRQMETK